MWPIQNPKFQVPPGILLCKSTVVRSIYFSYNPKPTLRLYMCAAPTNRAYICQDPSISKVLIRHKTGVSNKMPFLKKCQLMHLCWSSNLADLVEFALHFLPVYPPTHKFWLQPHRRSLRWVPTLFPVNFLFCIGDVLGVKRVHFTSQVEFTVLYTAEIRFTALL